jgi:hypothetical protein
VTPYKSELMNVKYTLTVALSALFSLQLIAQQTPANAQSQAIAIEGATLHVGNGDVIENGLIIFDNGQITYAGSADAKIARPEEVIKANGKHVYPGFIVPTKSLGLVEINAVRASDDADEIGEMIPHVRSIIAYNAESQVVESLRQNGMLMGQITPQGGRISGSSSIVQFDAWNWEDAAVKTDDGIHLNWPSAFRNGRWWAGEERGYRPNDQYREQIKQVLDFLVEAKAYLSGNQLPIHLPYAACAGLFNKSQRLYVYADGEREISDAIGSLKELGIENIVLVGGYHAEKVSDLLLQHKVPILVHNGHEIPEFEDDAYDYVYGLAARLHQKGHLVALQNASKSNFQVRNLPFYAGHAVQYGLSKEEALQLITLNTAKILGIDEHYGSLEAGKKATLFISEGDALDMRGNQLSRAFIDGRDISLETHQTKLWKRYKEKYESQ